MARGRTRRVARRTDETSELKNSVIVLVGTKVVESGQVSFALSELGLEVDSNRDTVIEKMAPLVRERYSVDISDYKVRKVPEFNNIFVVPNAVAGSEETFLGAKFEFKLGEEVVVRDYGNQPGQIETLKTHVPKMGKVVARFIGEDIHGGNKVKMYQVSSGPGLCMFMYEYSLERIGKKKD